ncbi:hypothetical protein HMI48_04435 [Acidithiobacillus ferrooxidans]|uniref:hypothetical protein n=1 Tax=Acidithiobacillus ferrooxidans TaxID=920 RepID=UPI001C07E4F8|nr:hypothetical protein [Acidithiobacillus ferrooxidans]MBU2773184.1 hypothetical protein [Acidithiobacillus ferrooxidans]
MKSRLFILSLGIFSMFLTMAMPQAFASTSGYSSLSPAQRIAHIQSRLGRLKHREVVLQSKGKTQRLTKVEARITKLQARLEKLQSK